MITGYPLFRGRDNQDQLIQIMKIVGTPSDATLAQIRMNSVSSVALSVVHRERPQAHTIQPEIQIKIPLAKHAKQPLQTIIPKAPRDGKLSLSL